MGMCGWIDEGEPIRVCEGEAMEVGFGYRYIRVTQSGWVLGWVYGGKAIGWVFGVVIWQ